MYINNIILYLYIIIYIQFVNAYEKGVVLSKDEVLKITNEYYISFFCKNDICVSVDGYERTIEIPDENGNLIKYISNTCTYDDIKSNKCIFMEKCKTDSQCLSNKCFDKYCVFNDETPVVHCDNIYTRATLFKEKSSYMYCGKAWRDSCKTNDECSSKVCYDGTCTEQKNGPDESDGFNIAIEACIFVSEILIVIIICCCCFCCCRNIYRKNKKINGPY